MEWDLTILGACGFHCSPNYIFLGIDKELQLPFLNQSQILYQKDATGIAQEQMGEVQDICSRSQ